RNARNKIADQRRQPQPVGDHPEHESQDERADKSEDQTVGVRHPDSLSRALQTWPLAAHRSRVCGPGQAGFPGSRPLFAEPTAAPPPAKEKEPGPTYPSTASAAAERGRFSLSTSKAILPSFRCTLTW